VISKTKSPERAMYLKVVHSPAFYESCSSKRRNEFHLYITTSLQELILKKAWFGRLSNTFLFLIKKSKQ